MQNTVAIWVTRILNPLIIPSLTLFLMLWQGGSYSAAIASRSIWMLPALVLTLTFVMPGIIFLLMIRLGHIKDPNMSNRYDRILPSIIAAIFFYGTYHLLQRLPIHPLFGYYILAATLLIVICLAVTYFWKISLHMSAMGAMTGTFVGLSYLLSVPFELLIVVSVILSGLVAFARLRLIAHTPAQVYAGYLLGFSVLLGLFLLQSA